MLISQLHNVVNQKTLGTMFSGGELFGVGALQAGYSHAWGIEYNDKIASVARQNGFNVHSADVRDFNPHKLGMYNKKLKILLGFINHLHASPECKRASSAKSDGEEEPQDKEMAGAVCE